MGGVFSMKKQDEQKDCFSSDHSGTTDQLMAIVYEELHAISSRLLRQEHSAYTLQPTALVHEVYLRLAENPNVIWSDRTHFLSIAARCVRQVLVGHARKRLTLKRGRDWGRLTLYEGALGNNDAMPPIDVLALEEALEELGKLDERQLRVVELRFYGGVTVSEAANIIGVSARTVDCDWAVARAWLAERLFSGK